MYRTSIRFAKVLDTSEVLLNKKRVRRIKLAEQQFRRKQYVTAEGPKGIRRVLSKLGKSGSEGCHLDMP